MARSILVSGQKLLDIRKTRGFPIDAALCVIQASARTWLEISDFCKVLKSHQ